MIAFANSNSDLMIECIPLSEITSIISHDENWAPISRSLPKHNTITPVFSGNERSQVPKLILEIHTLPDGYNSGHTYYLQASSDDEFRDIAAKFKHIVQAAVTKAKRLSTSARIHREVKYFFESFYFQFFVAVLIIMVRHKGGVSSCISSPLAPHTYPEPFEGKRMGAGDVAV
jgi:hypothetical protein